MPDNDLLRRYFDAGVAFTQLTRQRAENIVKEFVRQGEVSREQATARVEELLEQSRQNTEAIISIVRREIDERVSQLNLMTREDFAAAAARFGITVPGARKTGARKTAARKTAARKAAPRKTAARKAPAKKATAKKAPVKKAAARKTTAKKAAPRKTSAAKKTTAAAKKA